MKKISVIVPVYNVEKYLEKSIDSIMNQTYKDLEIILVDDGSSDGSSVICDAYAQRDKRITVIHKQNGGVSSARNIGINTSQGHYLSFVDPDDIIDLDMMQTLYNSLTEKGGDIATCDIQPFKEGETPDKDLAKNVVQVFSGKEALKEMLYQRHIVNGPCAKLYKKELFKGIRFLESITIAEDLEINYQLFIKAKKVIVNSSKDYYYLQRSGSAMHSTFSSKRMDGLIITKKILKDCVANYPSLVKAAEHRLFMEASYIISEITSFNDELHECESIIKQFSKKIMTDSESNKKHRLYAFASLVNVHTLWYWFKTKRRLSLLKRTVKKSLPKRSIKKVLLRFYSANNLGDDLFVKIITKRYENKFSLISHQEVSSFHSINNLVIYKNRILSSLSYRVGKVIKKSDLWLRMLERKNDLLVYIGGSIFIEGSDLKKWYQERDFYAKCKAPYFILGSNFGPYKNSEFVEIVGDIFKGAEDVCFRDNASYATFKDIPSVRVATDIAFSLDTSEYEMKNEKIAIFSLINCAERFDAATSKKYDKTIATLTKRLVADGYKVVYMSFCQPEGDEVANERIISKLDKITARNVEHYRYNGNLEEALQIIAKSSVVIGTRFHAAILGLVFKKKVLPFAYSDKTINILKDIQFKGPVVDIRNIDKFDATTFKFSQLKKNDMTDQTQLAETAFQELDKVLVKRTHHE